MKEIADHQREITMQWKQKIEHASHSDVGMRRDNNEDNCIVQICSDEEVWRKSGHLFLVADGMGGHAVGELASKLAAETVPHTFFKSPPGDQISAIRNALTSANRVIFDRGAGTPDFERMGTTCSTLVLAPAGAICGHVGDSRVYRVRGGRIDQLTFDHSLHWELMKSGQIKKDAAFANKNVITRCLGPEQSVEVDVEGPFPIREGDKYVLCSDGLTAHLNDSEIGQIAACLPAEKSARTMVNLANLRGGSDNCTVVVVDVARENEKGQEAKQPLPIWIWPIIGGIVLAILGVLLFAVIKMTSLGIATCLAGVVAIGVGLFLRSKAMKKDVLADTPVSTSKPYVSEPAKIREETVDLILAQVDSCVTDPSAAEINFKADELNAYRNKATAALKKQKRGTALRAALNAVNLCMTAIEDRRRDLDLAARWGKSE